MRVQRAVVAEEVVAPYVADELLTRQGNAAVAHHVEQQVVLLGGQIQLFALDGHLARGEVHHHIADGHLLTVGRGGHIGGGALQNGGHAHHQFTRRKGLDDIIINAQLEAVDAVILLAARGKHNHGNLRFAADFAAGGEAVEFGHHHIHDDEVVVLLPALFDGFHAV